MEFLQKVLWDSKEQYLCVCVLCTHAHKSGGQEETSDPSQLKLQMFVEHLACYVATGFELRSSWLYTKHYLTRSPLFHPKLLLICFRWESYDTDFFLPFFNFHSMGFVQPALRAESTTSRDDRQTALDELSHLTKRGRTRKVSHWLQRWDLWRSLTYEKRERQEWPWRPGSRNIVACAWTGTPSCVKEWLRKSIVSSHLISSEIGIRATARVP